MESVSKNATDANTQLSMLKKSIANIEKEIKVVSDAILKDDNDSPESSWRMMKLSLEETLGEKKKTVTKIEQDNIDKFIQKAAHNRTRNNQQPFNVAKADAESRVFHIVALPADEIAYCFSTSNLQIVPAWGNVRPYKLVYMWNHDLRKRENNIIPLSPGIEVPTKKDPVTGEVKDIHFMISFFYSDPKFIEKCTEYYKAFGITFSLTKDKKINNKFYIKLVVEKELIFTALAS